MAQIQLPQEIIDYYSKYKNTKTKFKQSTINGTNNFQIDECYEIIDSIGQGAYGVVVAAKDQSSVDEENNLVAIQQIEKAFEHKIFTRRTLRELKLLRLLKHQNVLNITKILLPKSREQLQDIYLVSELMETDLASIIQSQQVLSDDHCQFFLYQILRGLKYIHSAQVVHRDLKPRNLLVNSNCDLQIADFGLARSLVNVKIKANIMTDYVATRWYRAPELLLSWKQYNESVDVWSVGCIFAELLRRKPFLPGTDTKNQLELILQVIGTPSEQDINSIPQEKYKKIVQSMPKRAGKPLERLFPNASPKAIDLLKQFLTFDPKQRITVEQALNHPYLSELHFPDDEPTRDPVSKIQFEFEDHTLTLQQLKDLIYEEILLYHYPEFQTDYEKKKKNNQSVISHILKNANSTMQDPQTSQDQSSSDE